MSIPNHYNNSFSDNNILSIDSNSSLNDNIKYIKVYENSLKNIKNSVLSSFDSLHNDDEDNLSQFSGFSYINDIDIENQENDKLEENLVCKNSSDLDSELDFMFEYDTIYSNSKSKSKQIYDDIYLIGIKNKIMNKIKLNDKDLLHIQHTNETTKFEIIKLFSRGIE
jgi:hypothetical protein